MKSKVSICSVIVMVVTAGAMNAATADLPPVSRLSDGSWDTAVIQVQGKGQALKYVGKVVRDGIIYDVFKDGAKKVYKQVGRVKNPNTATYQAPSNGKCGYFSTTDWRGKVTYKRVCN